MARSDCILKKYNLSCSIQVPGGSIEMSEILDGVMFNKDVTHTGMKRRIENPR